MSKLVLREQGHQRRRGVKPLGLEIDKTPDHEVATVVHGETGETLFTLSVEPITRKVLVGVNQQSAVEVKDSMTKTIIVGRAAAKEKDPEGLRNWSIEHSKFKCWLPNGNAVEIEIEDHPGPFTPDASTVHEPLGQPEMVFAIAFAIKHHLHWLLEGPTGTAKTSTCEWLASVLNWNYVRMPISRGTEDVHMIGSHMPGKVAGEYPWMDGPVTHAARLSAEPCEVDSNHKHPTMLVLDELNRIGNVAEIARIYSLLDDGRFLELKERRSENGIVERIVAGPLFIGATSNPSDEDSYVGVQDLDKALLSRFGPKPHIGYPVPEVESKALMLRVPGLKQQESDAMVAAAKRIRENPTVSFPISFRELMNWAMALPFYGWKQAAEVAFITKADPEFQPDLRNLIKLQGR